VAIEVGINVSHPLSDSARVPSEKNNAAVKLRLKLSQPFSYAKKRSGTGSLVSMKTSEDYKSWAFSCMIAVENYMFTGVNYI
jgi:uncharacterized protein YcnI